MAQRQSLKDLQTRLAQRLAETKSESATASWLAVEVGGRRYLFPLVQSGEIFPWGSVQSVPYTQAWYLGVAGLRGGLYGVVDLAALIGDAVAGSGSVDRSGAEVRLVGLHPALEVNAVLKVDRLLGLRTPGMFKSFGEHATDAPAFFGRIFVDMQDESWQELDLQALALSDEFLTISV